MSENYRCGRIIVKNNNGYLRVFYPCHPKGEWVQHHRVVMELFLGRYLEEGEIVHHINNIRDDNRIENLELVNREGHTSCHMSGEKHPMFGKKHTEETKKKMSANRTGEKAHMFGKKHSEETKRKMSESARKDRAKRKRIGFPRPIPKPFQLPQEPL
jgi:hypothetical protein